MIDIAIRNKRPELVELTLPKRIGNTDQYTAWTGRVLSDGSTAFADTKEEVCDKLSGVFNQVRL